MSPPAHVAAHPVVGRLRPQPQVLRGAMRLGHQVHRLALLSSLATMVRARYVFPVPGRPVSSRELPARQWLVRSFTPFHLVVWGAPPPCARPAAQQRPRLFYAVDGRAVRVAQRLQRSQPLREALRQPLRQQAVRLHLRERGGASRMRRALATMQCLKPSTASDGAVGAVAQQPRA